MIMDSRIEAVLQDYERRAEAEARLMRDLPLEQLASRIDEFLISVGPRTGRFLHDLAVGAGATRILEIGTSYGYSTLWLAAAARAAGGRVLSIELAAAKQDHARAALGRAGLDAQVEFIAGDALVVLGTLAGPFDLVLIDLWKDLYVPCFDLIRPKLARGAFVVADNMIEPAYVRADADRYRAHVRAVASESLLLPIGSGIEVSRFAG